MIMTRAASNGTPPSRPKMRRRPPCRDSGGDERSRELAERIAVHSRSISTLQQQLFTDLAEFDRSEAWRGDGAVGMTAWLTERCVISSGTARLWAQTAAKLESLPHLTDALADGSLTLDAVVPLTHIAHPDNDAELAKAAADLSVKQVRDLVASRKRPPQNQGAREFADRTFRLNDEKCSIWASMTKDDYAILKSQLIAAVRCRDESGSAAPEAGGPGTGGDPLDYIPFDQKLYDAFADLFRNLDGMSPLLNGFKGIDGFDGGRGGRGGRGGDSDDGAGSGSGTGHGGESAAAGDRSGRTTPRRRFQPTVVVHADYEWLAGVGNPDEEGSESGSGEISGLGQLARESAQRLACDAKIIFSLERHDGSILDQKRARRSPTNLQRIEVARRDKGCRFPGCPFSDFTEVHHIHPWELGGETNLANLITLCGRHHHAVHELGWSMKGSADELITFAGPHGHPMTSAPSPTWPGSRPMRR
jgi:hypothetical protein